MKSLVEEAMGLVNARFPANKVTFTEIIKELGVTQEDFALMMLSFVKGAEELEAKVPLEFLEKDPVRKINIKMDTMLVTNILLLGYYLRIAIERQAN